MTQRNRKLLGTVFLLLLVAVYAVLAVAVAIVLQVRDASKFTELAYYIVVGLLWTLPAGWLIAWMQRPDV
ncbi:MAG TPA: DUF2842 domain-containing protein [Hyphomicrobium sp.]|jgi:uncharacterized membrane protein